MSMTVVELAVLLPSHLMSGDLAVALSTVGYPVRKTVTTTHG